MQAGAYICMYVYKCMCVYVLLSGAQPQSHLLATEVLLSDSTSRLCRGHEKDVPGAVSPAGQRGG